MKKFLIYILAFFFTVAVIDLIVGKAADYMIANAKSGSMKQLTDLCNRDKYDMLVMGSSKAHHNYIPQVFCDSLGVSCYNAGYDGEGIILAYGILSLIEDSRLPKTIIYDAKLQYDAYSMNLDGDYTRYYRKLRPFYGKPAVDSIIRNISETDFIKLHSNLYRTNGILISTVSGFLRSSEKDPNYGYVPEYGQLTDNSKADRDYQGNIDGIKIDYFRKFVDLTKEKGIELIVVFSPEFNTPYSSDYQPILDICSASGITVLDYFDNSMFQDISLFSDHCHMNERGARLFSSLIADKLKQVFK